MGPRTVCLEVAGDGKARILARIGASPTSRPQTDVRRCSRTACPGLKCRGAPSAGAARNRPRRRLPIETNPVLITRNGKPVLVSSSIGMGVHEQTDQAIVNVPEYGLGPKAAAESP